MSIFKDNSGGWSSKRAVGLSYAALGIVMVIFGLISDKQTDMEILLVVVGTALTALGISNFSKPKKEDIQGITPPPGTPPKGDDPDN